MCYILLRSMACKWIALIFLLACSGQPEKAIPANNNTLAFELNAGKAQVVVAVHPADCHNCIAGMNLFLGRFDQLFTGIYPDIWIVFPDIRNKVAKKYLNDLDFKGRDYRQLISEEAYQEAYILCPMAKSKSFILMESKKGLDCLNIKRLDFTELEQQIQDFYL